MKDKEMAEESYKNCKFEKIEHYCDKAIYVTGYLAGLKAGRPQWHDLRKDPNDLPKCEENKQLLFYVEEWYESIQKYKNHYCLGFYKKSFMNDDVKLFVEKSKGYECEHLPKSVFKWIEIEIL